MKHFLKTSLLKTTLVAISLSVLGVANAGAKSDSDYLADCKASIHTQFDQVSKVDIASLNSRRNLFRAKFRVKSEQGRSMVLCEIKDGQVATLDCLKGKMCDANNIASANQ